MKQNQLVIASNKLLVLIHSAFLVMALSPLAQAVGPEVESKEGGSKRIELEVNIAMMPAAIQQVRERYGFFASRRVNQWQELVNSTSETLSPTELQDSLKRVNRFFNQIPYQEDQHHWQSEDYWASPVEFIGSNGGDCEDYSIAKYFTLRAMGIADSDLRITYVRSKTSKAEHMVLLYLGESRSDPLVLDNVETSIKPLSERQDLLMTYSFNSESLWQISLFGKQALIGKATTIEQWSSLLLRLKS